MNTKIQTGRVYYLDLIKTFSIFLVVFCHIPARDPDSVLTNIFMLLAFTACPLFFLCSGAVMIPSKTWSWSKWRKRLLKTYLSISVWKLLYLLLFHWLNGAACAPAQLVNYLFLFGSLENVDAAHFWFMHAYLVCLLIQPLAWQLWHGGREGKTALLLAALTAYLGSSYILSPNLITMLLHRLPGLEGFSLAPLMEIRPFGNHSNMLVYFLLGSFLHTLSTGELKSAHSGHTPPSVYSPP